MSLYQEFLANKVYQQDKYSKVPFDCSVDINMGNFLFCRFLHVKFLGGAVIKVEEGHVKTKFCLATSMLIKIKTKN